MMHDLVSLYDPGSCMRKGCRRENWGPSVTQFVPHSWTKPLSELSFTLGVFPWCLQWRGWWPSLFNSISHFDNSAFQGKQTTMFLFCNVCLLFTHLHSFLFTNGEVKWIKSVCRIERLYYVFLFLKGALEILVGSLQCKHYMQSHTWPLITSKGKETLSQEGVGEMCRVVLIHTSFTYTNGSCLRKEKEGKEVER